LNIDKVSRGELVSNLVCYVVNAISREIDSKYAIDRKTRFIIYYISQNKIIIYNK